MAEKKYRLLKEAVTAGADFVGDLQPGDEFAHDFTDPTGRDAEQAVIAAGWVEPLDAPAAPADIQEGDES